MSLPQNASSANAQDMARFEQYLIAARPYFATFKPGDWEANRELVRRMAAYSMTLGVLSQRNPQLRSAYSRINGVIGGIPFPAGYYAALQSGSDQSDAEPVAPVTKRPVPFPVSAPDMGTVAAAEREKAAEGKTRYEQSATRAAAAWESVEQVRQGLESRNMSLNAQASTSLSRLPLLFQAASDALERHDWDAATASLAQADGETQKILRTVGR
jgi:hypothetical protein